MEALANTKKNICPSKSALSPVFRAKFMAALRKKIDDFPMIGVSLDRQQYCQLERNKGKLGKIIVTI